MAVVTRTYKTDDLDNSEDEVSTVHFARDKINYEIDLSAVNSSPSATSSASSGGGSFGGWWGHSTANRPFK